LFELFAPAGSKPETTKDIADEVAAETAEASEWPADKPAAPKRATKTRRQRPDTE
jgi:hypothetical protein